MCSLTLLRFDPLVAPAAQGPRPSKVIYRFAPRGSGCSSPRRTHQWHESLAGTGAAAELSEYRLYELA